MFGIEGSSAVGRFRLPSVVLVALTVVLVVWTPGVRAATSFAGTAKGSLGSVRSGRSPAARTLHAASSASVSTTPCRAARSTTGNVQVDCTRGDTGIVNDIQLDQSEPSVVIDGSKVLSAFNDGYGGFGSNPSWLGYAVSHDGGVSWTDMGNVPPAPRVTPWSDPSLAVDNHANVWLTTMATTPGFPRKWELGLWEMPVARDAFHLVSTPVIAPYQVDKPLLAIGRDGRGHEHFYIAYTQYSITPANIQGPVVLLDSIDGVKWRHTQLTESHLCEPVSPGAAPVPDGRSVDVFFNELDHAACAHDPIVDPTVTRGHEDVIAVNTATGAILHRRTVATIHGNGELVDQQCGGAQVIQTAPDLEGRNASLPAPTLGPDGVLYDAWSDRPRGLGGGFNNATRIYLAYSRNGGATWSPPKVISGPLSPTHMADRFQPALTADAYGLHAIWYERVAAPAGGPDLIRTDRADLTLAGATTGPALLSGGERPLSTIPWQFLSALTTNCYAGDYNQVASNGVRAIAAWTDLRNTALTVEGTVAHKLDVFSDHWQVRPTPAEIKALLIAELTITGRSATIPAVLHRGGYVLSSIALSAGKAAIAWSDLATGTTPTLVARGTATVRTAATATILIKLTKTGRQLLTHVRQLKLIATASFTPTGSHAILAAKPFTLKR